jgi:signal transduction histidine kinase
MTHSDYVVPDRRSGTLCAIPLSTLAPPTGPVRVLLADDTAEIRSLLRIVLELDGRFEVVGEAADGHEAVQAADDLRPDVAVVDLAMPVMDGLEAIPLIRDCSPDTKVVVLSAFSARQMREQALAAGAHGYLEKGTPSDEVITVLAGMVGAQRSRSPESPSAPVEPGASEDTGAALDELLAHLTHELRTPVAVVQGFAATLKMAVQRGDHDNVVRCADALERNVAVLGELVQSFNDARAVDLGKLELDLAMTDLVALVHDMADLEVVTAGHPLDLRLDAPAEETMVLSLDAVRIRQVITNLVSNAAKFSPAGAPIEIGLAARGGVAELSVRDRGPGIPAGDEHRLFSKFGRLHEDVKGTGLGLFISRAIARAHGGDLVLGQPPADGGARFVLRLPLEARPAA